MLKVVNINRFVIKLLDFVINNANKITFVCHLRGILKILVFIPKL